MKIQKGNKPLHIRDERIVADILAFSKRQFDADELSRSLPDMFKEGLLSTQILVPLLVYAWPMAGKPLAEHFFHAQHEHLDDDDRTWIKLQLATSLSVWEVLHVDYGKGMNVVDKLTDAQHFVQEISGSKTLTPGDVVLARMVVHDDIAVFCGLHQSSMGPFGAAVISRFRESGLAREEWAATTCLLGLWHEQIAAAKSKVSE